MSDQLFIGLLTHIHTMLSVAFKDTRKPKVAAIQPWPWTGLRALFLVPVIAQTRTNLGGAWRTNSNYEFKMYVYELIFESNITNIRYICSLTQCLLIHGLDQRLPCLTIGCPSLVQALEGSITVTSKNWKQNNVIWLKTTIVKFAIFERQLLPHSPNVVCNAAPTT